MANWLLKTEPSTYSWDDLVKDKRTTWDGVTNALALKHIRTMKKGDSVLIYHTGDEKSIVGIAEVTTNPYPDPKANNEKIVVVDLKPGKKFTNHVTLSVIKSDKLFAEWELVRIGRLSVMPVPDPIWKQIISLSNT